MESLFEMLEPVEVKKEEPKGKNDVKKEKKKEEKTVEKTKYKYPFTFHYAGRNLEISHIFEEDKEYTCEEITKAMLEHQFYEFSGNVTYDFIEADNVLIPIFQQHKKG